MKHTAIYQRISELLHLMETHNRRISGTKSSAAPIDVDLMRSYTLELYGLLNQLESLPVDQKAPTVEREETAVAPVSQPVLIEQALVLESDEATPESDKVDADLKTPLNKNPEPLVQIQETLEAEEEVLIEKKTPTSVVSNKVSLDEDENTYKGSSPSTKKPEEAQLKLSVHDKAGLDQKTKIYEKFNKAGIESIRKNVSIMKRFELQKSLFKDNPDYYNDAIRFFDDAPGLSDAINEFNDLGTHFGWDMESDLVAELRDLITRRHM